MMRVCVGVGDKMITGGKHVTALRVLTSDKVECGDARQSTLYSPESSVLDIDLRPSSGVSTLWGTFILQTSHLEIMERGKNVVRLVWGK
ncbi:ras-specific guanine nucleotide-releasing factor RalGPS2-like X4, partial [Biomphalaria pfeifferi]